MQISPDTTELISESWQGWFESICCTDVFLALQRML